MPDFYQNAHFLYTNGSYALADRELRKLLAESPSDCNAHALLAHTLIKQHRYDDALNESKAAVSADPDSAYAYHSLAASQLKLEKFEDAAQAVRRSLELEPEAAHHYALAGEIDLNLRKPEEALKFSSEGIALNPCHIDSLNIAAIALNQLNRPLEADELLNRALALDPQRYYLHANKGDVALNLKDSALAFKHFREAIRINPTWKSGPQSILRSASQSSVSLKLVLALTDALYELIGRLTELNYAFFQILKPGFISSPATTATSTPDPTSTADLLPKLSFFEMIFLPIKVVIFLFVGVFYFVPLIFLTQAIFFVLDRAYERCLQGVIKSREKVGQQYN